MKLEELKQFLVDANTNGYASASANAQKEADGSTSISYLSGEWKIHDNYFGGEPFGGREIVFYRNMPFWIMVYYGRVVQGFNPNEVFQFLKEALLSMPPETPYRGNKYFRRGNFEYFNDPTGEVDCFEGRERITFEGRDCYEGRYSGGLVDVKQ